MADPDFLASDDLMSRADAFMNRQRPRPPLADELDDLPVLTDIVTPPPATSSPATPAPDLEALGEALAAAVRQRLAAELPTLVEASMQAAIASISQDLHQGLESISREAIADFLARQHRPPGA